MVGMIEQAFLLLHCQWRNQLPVSLFSRSAVHLGGWWMLWELRQVLVCG